MADALPCSNYCCHFRSLAIVDTVSHAQSFVGDGRHRSLRSLQGAAWSATMRQNECARMRARTMTAHPTRAGRAKPNSVLGWQSPAFSIRANHRASCNPADMDATTDHSHGKGEGCGECRLVFPTVTNDFQMQRLGAILTQMSETTMGRDILPAKSHARRRRPGPLIH